MTSEPDQGGAGRHTAGSRARWRVAALTVAAYLAAAGPVTGFQAIGKLPRSSSPDRSEPALPGAVTRPPDGIGPGAPFDVSVFFAAPPPELNAAPLYLDALFDFEPEIAVCFRPDAQTTRRRDAARRRKRTIDALYTSLSKDPASVSTSAIDELLAEAGPLLRRVEEAQRRPRCMFQTGLDYSSPLPHAQAARQVARLVTLKIRRCLERGDVETPLHDLEIVLRLLRDLRPRAPMVCQLVADLLGVICAKEMIPPLLASPELHERQARQLLDLLARHEASSVNGFEQGIKAEYVLLRGFLARMVRDPRWALDRLASDGAKSPPLSKETKDLRDQVFIATVKGLDPSAIGRVNARIDAFYRDVLAFKDGPIAHWPEKQFDPGRIRDGSGYDLIAMNMMSFIRPPAEFEARARAAVRADECLVALRLWRDRTREAPTELEAVVKAAGMPRVPVDPYSGQPLRMAIVDGEPVVYSIGKDGRDDGGRVDSDSERRPGDQTFRLPAMGKKRP